MQASAQFYFGHLNYRVDIGLAVVIFFSRGIKMKKILINLFVLIAAMGISTISLAEDVSPENDVTTLGTLQPHQTKMRTFNLIEGVNKINVSSDEDDALFTCRFYNDGGFVGLEQVNVPNCSGTVNLKLPMTLQLEITNSSNKTLDYRVNLHRSPSVKKIKKVKSK